MSKRKRVNYKKVVIAIFLILIATCVGVFLIIKNNPKLYNEISEKTDIQPENNVIENKEEKQEDISIHLNNLKDDESSFGNLDVPVYKINEKNIKVPILIYHGFSTPMLSNEDDPYKLMCSEDLFEDQITTLKEAGYTFITLEDMYKYKQGKIGLPEKNITITMDDGWLGNYTEAFNIIKQYNVPATIFIVEDLVGTEGYFDWEQAKEMYDSGLVKIHVHGRHHKDATGYSNEQLISDYNHTHSLIEEKLDAKIQKIMAYPAGKSDTNTIKTLKEAGFEVQVQTKYGTVNKSTSLDLTGLGRIRAEKASGDSILKTINNATVN